MDMGTHPPPFHLTGSAPRRAATSSLQLVTSGRSFQLASPRPPCFAIPTSLGSGLDAPTCIRVSSWSRPGWITHRPLSAPGRLAPVPDKCDGPTATEANCRLDLCMDMAQDRPYSAQTSQRTGCLLGTPPRPKSAPGGVSAMAPAALRTTGADTAAFSGVGCDTGVFPSSRMLAFPHTSSGLSSLTSKLVPLAATCGSQPGPPLRHLAPTPNSTSTTSSASSWTSSTPGPRQPARLASFAGSAACPAPPPSFPNCSRDRGAPGPFTRTRSLPRPASPLWSPLRFA